MSHDYGSLCLSNELVHICVFVCMCVCVRERERVDSARLLVSAFQLVIICVIECVSVCFS